MIEILQYEEDGEQEVKYAEMTDSTDENTFRRVIRDPEDSLYNAPLEMDTVSNARDSEAFEEGTMFPEHYVTAFDYEKARDLENEGILGLGENQNGNIVSVGSYIGDALFELVDDMGITGYNVNPDRDLPDATTEVSSPLVSDSFGMSLQDYRDNPTTEKRQYLESVARGMYQIQESEGWGTSIALEGTLENPELIPTDQETVNEIRQEGAYDEVRSRVT
ncbi:hypothetical protein [Halorientalis pallida]|uniref:Uncharacterized protein n=1 Tax=Halorientalis pallida TaxID=2479928 RepID=A0A498L601_9EURY|nr:hypothetical protein [Halorientalis pallida]RXK51712.1 hypothetical protein EAF64_03515 [Halorientalis pallida]